MLQPMGLQRVGHNLVAEPPPPLENVYPHTHTHTQNAAGTLAIPPAC